MYQHRIFLQTDERRGEIYRGLLQTAASAQFDSMTVLVAFATRRGCEFIAESLQSHVSRWRQIAKEWLISIDRGFTEPDALEFLAGLPNSHVRIPNAEAVLSRELQPEISFHSKLYLFRCQDNQGAMGVFSGSANLTVSGLCFNNEQAIALICIPPLSRSDRPHYDHLEQQGEVIDHIFASGTLLDEDLLDRYRAVRRPRRRSEDRTRPVENIFEPNPVLPLSTAVAIVTASSFWVDVHYVTPNRGPHREGNQIDLQKGSRVFFGFGAGEVRRNTVLGTVRIRFEGEVIDCNMRYGDNQMDKLNLPIPGDPGPPTYINQTLLFRRNANGTFDLHLGSADEITQWKRRSEQQRTLFRLRSGRECGVFT